VVDDEIIAVLEITAPGFSPLATITVSVNVAAPGGITAVEQEIVPADPAGGVAHVQPEGTLRDTNLVPAGRASESVRALASLGPMFVTESVSVRFAPGATGSGVAVLAIARSAWAGPTVDAVVLLLLTGFRSVADVEIVAVFETVVPGTAPEAVATTNVNVAFPGGKDGFVQEIEPEAPGGGVAHDHPAGVAAETNVVPAGSGSFSVVAGAAFGPAFVATMVYVMFAPGVTVAGTPLFETDRSAKGSTVTA
jgi:hypothetical protein